MCMLYVLYDVCFHVVDVLMCAEFVYVVCIWCGCDYVCYVSCCINVVLYVCLDCMFGYAAHGWLSMLRVS